MNFDSQDSNRKFCALPGSRRMPFKSIVVSVEPAAVFTTFRMWTDEKPIAPADLAGFHFDGVILPSLSPITARIRGLIAIWRPEKSRFHMLEDFRFVLEPPGSVVARAFGAAMPARGVRFCCELARSCASASSQNSISLPVGHPALVQICRAAALICASSISFIVSIAVSIVLFS
jgi:hypothetical protein